MGLSSMSDETKHASVDHLYGHRFYANPVKHEWHSWYAWYPIQIIEWKEYGLRSGWFKVSRWIWLQKVMRREIEDRGVSGFIRGKRYMEYTSIEGYLRHG